MGGCATKPKVVKGDDRDVPVPEPTKEPVAAVPEAKEVDVDKAKDADDEANQKPAISNLLDESEKEITETESDGKTLLESTKTESVEAVEQESTETKVAIETTNEAEPLSIESKAAAAVEATKEAEPLSIESKAAAAVEATKVDAGETQKGETSAAAKDEVAK